MKDKSFKQEVISFVCELEYEFAQKSRRESASPTGCNIPERMKTKMDFHDLLKRFTDINGRLTAYPSKQTPKLAALFLLTEGFEAERRYTEKEINAVIESKCAFSDTPMLRRELINNQFLCRERDGSAYWLNPDRPDPEKAFPEA